MTLLHSGFLESAHAMPDRPALHVAGESLSYRALAQSAMRIAATLQRWRDEDTPALTAVFADRSATAFAGILGALLAGHGYVPLNPHFPVARTRWMLERGGCASLIVDATAWTQIDDILSGIPSSLPILLPDEADADALSSRWPQHSFVAARDRELAASWSDGPQSEDAVAYLLFTSGSTCEPKGVPVSHANVAHFVNAMVERYDIEPDDRFSQMFHTTFDLSVFDLFVAGAGARACTARRGRRCSIPTASSASTR